MIGRKIGRYRIEKKLGEGGMGSVWLAVDPFLKRKVALKLISTSLMDIEGSRVRFEREARIASGLKHPGLATVYDAGREGDQDYIAFQYIEGRTLGDLILDGPLPIAQAARITRDIAEALHYAHTQGVIHRDVKSNNIIIGPGGRAVLVDFGLALPEGETRLTMTGSVMGTVGYLSPEVARGERADVRSDIYGLGVVLYEMLTGKLPFTAEKQQAVIYKILNEPPPRPSAGRPEVPPELDQVTVRAMQKAPGSRYASAADLASAVASFSPAAAREDRTRRLTGAFFAPQRRWIWKTLILAGAILAAVWPSSPPSRTELRPPTPAAIELYKQGLALMEERPIRASSLFKEAVQESPHYVDAWIGLGATYRIQRPAGNPEESNAAFRRAIELDPDRIEPYRGLIRNSDKAENALQLANDFWRTGNRDYQTMMLMSDAFRIGGLEDFCIPFLERAIELDPDSPEPHYHLSFLSVHIGNFDRAIEAGKAHLMYGADAEGSFWIGLAHHMLGDLETAKTYYDTTLETSGAKVPLYAFLYIGALYQEVGYEDAARQIWFRGLDLAETRLALTPDSSLLLWWATEAAVRLGHEKRAKELMEAADEKALAGFHSPFVMSKQAVAEKILRMMRDGYNPGVPFITMAEIDGYGDFQAAPEYKEMLIEYYKLQKRLREQYGDLDILREYEPKFSFPG